MRYQKGSIGLNYIKDKAILRFVADSRYVTRSQLNSFALLDYSELNRIYKVVGSVKHNPSATSFLSVLGKGTPISVARFHHTSIRSR